MEKLRAVVGRGNLLERGVGDIVVVGLGNNGGCKGMSNGAVKKYEVDI